MLAISVDPVTDQLSTKRRPYCGVLLLIICVRMLTYYYACLRMVTCACMHGIAHAQFCSRPRVVVIIPGTLTADGGRYNW